MTALFTPILPVYFIYHFDSEQLYQVRFSYFWLEICQTVGLSTTFEYR